MREYAVRQIVLADNALRTSLAAYAASETLKAAAQTNFDAALSSLVADGTQGLVVSSDGMFLAHRQQLVDTTIRHRLPAIFA